MKVKIIFFRTICIYGGWKARKWTVPIQSVLLPSILTVEDLETYKLFNFLF
jgi:hypothetical protein